MKKPFAAAQRALSLSLAAGLLALAGCATVANPNPRDPWESFNRPMFEFNDKLDQVVLKPVATLYRDKVPPLVRTGVANFFGNLEDAWSFVNSALQFKLQDAAENFARVQTNTLWGVFGIFDVASEFNIERHKEDFGQTLGRWGVPAGPYLMLPFFGPSTLRDAVALPVDRRYNLVQQIDSQTGRTLTYSLALVDKRSTLLRASDVLDQAALDKYAFIRDAHLQRRRAEINEKDDDLRDVPPALPDESKDPNAPAAATPAAPAAAPAQPAPAPAGPPPQ